MTAEELLAQLRDIQEPAAPAWWLIAPVYLIIFAAVAGLLLLAWFWYRKRKSQRLMRLAQRELEQIIFDYEKSSNESELAQKLATWLKQVAIQAFPEHNPAALCGAGWTRFLDQTTDKVSFSDDDGNIFTTVVYSRNPHFNAAATIRLCRQWFLQIQPKLLLRGRQDA